MPSYPPSVTLRSVTGPVDAVVRVPGSKSITNRALLLAGLAEGESVLRGALASDDTARMRDALMAMGVEIVGDGAERWRVRGVAGRLRAPDGPLMVGNSGTSARFLTAACVHLPEGASCVLDGVERMRQRPIQDLIDALAPLGGRVESVNATGCPPVRVYGGGLRGGETRVSGAVSSQYLSALMMTAPLASGGVSIRVEGELASRPYIALTEHVMAAFGASADTGGLSRRGELRLPAPQPGVYRARDFVVEPDASNAAYFLAAAAVTGGRVTVEGLGSASVQGDVHFAGLLEQMGCAAAYHGGSEGVTLQGPDRLQGIDANLLLMPDTAPTLAVCALFARGKSVIRGIHTLRVKETDRVAAVAAELRKLGASVEAGDDYWIIDPPAHAPRPGADAIATYDDHRMAMAFAVAALRVDQLRIDDPGCVAKTFPDFWERWSRAFYAPFGEEAP